MSLDPKWGTERSKEAKISEEAASNNSVDSFGGFSQPLGPPYASMWLRAMLAMEMEKYSYAQQLLGPIIRHMPEFLPARQLARKAALAQHKNRGKMRFVLSFFLLFRAQFYLKRNPLAAMNQVEAILKTDPSNIPANHLLKKAALAMNMLGVGTFALETIRAAQPQNVKAMHELAILYSKQNQFDLAATVYQQILAARPNDHHATKGARDVAAHIIIQQTQNKTSTEALVISQTDKCSQEPLRIGSCQ